MFKFSESKPNKEVKKTPIPTKEDNFQFVGGEKMPQGEKYEDYYQASKSGKEISDPDEVRQKRMQYLVGLGFSQEGAELQIAEEEAKEKKRKMYAREKENDDQQLAA